MSTIVQVLPTEEGSCFFIHGRYISFLNLDGSITTSYQNESLLTRAAAIHKDRLVICDVSKTVKLFSIANDWKLTEIATGLLEKAAMSATFDSKGSILISDKFGDIIRFPARVDTTTTTVNNSTPWVGITIAGCVSMATDLLTNSHFIIMADRDEKVRLINADLPFVIERFLLAHTEYVAAIKLIPSLSNDIHLERLVSIGGDKRLLLWSLYKDEPLQTVILDNISEKFDPIGLAISNEAIAFCLNDISQVFFLSISKDGLISDTVTFAPLPNGFRPTVLSHVGGQRKRLLVAGLDFQSKPFLGQFVENHDKFEIIHTFDSYSESLPCKQSLSWPQVIRAHLRKRRFTADTIDSNDNEEEEQDSDNE